MDIIKNLIFGLLGLAGILYGGELVVDNAKKIARSLKINEFFIGLTVLSIGTSLPEIFTHIMSSIRIAYLGEPYTTLSGIAVGTNVGSNIIQITLITGLSALVGIIYTNKKFLHRDYIFMLFGIVLVWLFSLNHVISHVEGMILAILYILYIYYLAEKEELDEKLENGNDNKHDRKINIIRSLYMVLGLSLLILGANFVLDAALFGTKYFGISGSLIGALVIGVATALPEFTTSVIGLLKKSSGISLGTLVGSNITNPLLALGIGASISGYYVDDALIYFDLPFWFITSLIIFFLFYRGLRLNRIEGAICASFYIVFIVLRLYLYL